MACQVLCHFSHRLELSLVGGQYPLRDCKHVQRCFDEEIPRAIQHVLTHHPNNWRLTERMLCAHVEKSQKLFEDTLPFFC